MGLKRVKDRLGATEPTPETDQEVAAVLRKSRRCMGENFNPYLSAYNALRQRFLGGLKPDTIVRINRQKNLDFNGLHRGIPISELTLELIATADLIVNGLFVMYIHQRFPKQLKIKPNMTLKDLLIIVKDLS